ncbi:MAG: GNAT family N-acetyltransferase [Gordonia sp. (in: high G+C Gram-positive bacteria)]|uniref:GNAT family N-acetyltransferase n=1 Tax=Gordonia sp. (in: high G+C Gram-positive bacteria) TaxID=84139 RepID=UPI003BB7A187
MTARTATNHPLDDPFGSALRGRHARFARSHRSAIAYDTAVSVFYAHPPELTPAAYRDLAVLAGPHGTIGLRDRSTPLPSGWQRLETFSLVQYTGEHVATSVDPTLVALGPGDVAEMTALVRLTEPGPFLPRTIELGRYLGYRDRQSGQLLAMAGERAQPDGWTEISAVCTHPQARGRGLAHALIGAVTAGIVARGDLPFLHTTHDNPARRLYESMGFIHRSTVTLEIVRVPGKD